MESICPSRTKSPTPGTEFEASKRSKADRGKGRRLARMMLRANEAKIAEKKEERNWLATKSLTPGTKLKVSKSRKQLSILPNNERKT